MVRLRQQNSSLLLLEASRIKRKIDGNSYLINRNLWRETMAEENILFCYMLTDAWGLRLAKVTVFKDGKVQYKDGKRKESCCKLNEPSLKQIKEILKQHAVIFEYTSSEIEFPNILDGVMNFFTFATQEGESVELMAFNIGEVRNPKGYFLEGFMPTSEKIY